LLSTFSRLAKPAELVVRSSLQFQLPLMIEVSGSSEPKL